MKIDVFNYKEANNISENNSEIITKINDIFNNNQNSLKLKKNTKLKEPYYKAAFRAMKRCRRQSKISFPFYWSNYPHIVRGVINDVVLKCSEIELQERLKISLESFFFNKYSIIECVNATTLRRYLIAMTDKLTNLLGTNGIAPVIENFLKPTVSFPKFKLFAEKHFDEIKQYYDEERVSNNNSEIRKILNENNDNINKKNFNYDEKNEEKKPVKYLRETSNSNKLMAVASSSCTSNVLINKNISLVNVFNTNSMLKSIKEENTLSPLSDFLTQTKRRIFTGTLDELRNELKLILNNHYSSNLNSIVEVVIGAIIKENSLRIGMNRSGVSLNTLLAAYSFCGRHIALDKVQIFDENEKQNQLLKNMLINENKNFYDLNFLDVICIDFINIYNKKTVKEEDTYKILINFVVEVCYKRSENDRDLLKSCLEVILIDGLSLESALSEFQNLRREYTQRCQKIHNFLSSHLYNFFQENKNHRVEKEENNIKSLSNYLNKVCILSITKFLKDISRIPFTIPKVFIIQLVRKLIFLQNHSKASSFEWTNEMDKWLAKDNIINYL